MIKIENYNVAVSRGDSACLTFHFYNDDEIPYQFQSGDYAVFTVARDSMELVFKKQSPDLGNIKDNFVDFLLTPEDTKELPF